MPGLSQSRRCGGAGGAVVQGMGWCKERSDTGGAVVSGVQ